mgnify:CR=1 FL=1
MTDNALTKREQQEIRGAEARLSRVEKLQEELAKAQAAASERTIQKIEDINAQVIKLDERGAKIDEQIAATEVRKQALVARRDELVKAKFVLADEIAEYLTPADHERLGLDTPVNVTDNTVLTTEQVDAIAESAHEDDETEDEEDNGPSMVMEDAPEPRDLKAEMNADLATAKEEVAVKATRSRAKAK